MYSKEYLQTALQSAIEEMSAVCIKKIDEAYQIGIQTGLIVANHEHELTGKAPDHILLMRKMQGITLKEGDLLLKDINTQMGVRSDIENLDTLLINPTKSGG